MNRQGPGGCLTVRCEYPDGSSPPTEVSFRLSPSYGLLTARDAHDWFLMMMGEHAEFEVETDEPGEAPMLFVGGTVRWVVAQQRACPQQALLRIVW